jgi:hypothetical protein
MRKSLVLALVLVAAGCSRAPERDTPSGTARADQASAPAGITPTAAPGVAFNYHYAFRLPGERIAAVQEEHALACEKLGIARCRITGMTYHLTGEREVEAQLDFKLDPALARGFGKQGIEAVGRADGLLVESEISGEDAGGAIAAASRSEAQLGEQRARMEAQLARRGLGDEERSQLQDQVRQLQESIRASRDSKADRQESLASTPMSFAYASGDMAPGVRRTLADAGANFVAGLEWILLAAITLLPWLALLLAAWWAGRRIMTRLAPRAPRAA